MRKKLDDTKWRNILAEIKANVTDVSYRTWFLSLTPIEYDDESKNLYVGCTEEFKINVIRQRYIPEFEKSIEKVLKGRYKVVLRHMTDEEIENIKSGMSEQMARTVTRANQDSFKEEYYLNPKYNFNNFVVGANNNYAHAVCLAVAESPSIVYNPLFIYGGPGLGKTHLMHAIGHYILEHYPQKNVLYVSSEMFTNELINALRDPNNANSKLSSFKQKYRTVDVLLIDDIQFIEGKDAVQTEFFHTFNTLYELNKQIVITSDKHPSRLTDLDERLKSRFAWNIIADIQPPDYETRVAILRNKAEQEGIELDADVLDVIDLLAEKIKMNVRDLESALVRLGSFSQVFNQKITVKFAKEKLKDIFSSRDVNITCETIKKLVCKKYNIKITDMESSKRKREFTYPRQIAMYLCREMTDLSLPKIGQSFGGRDHTTVLHACDKITSELKLNEALADEIRSMKEELI